MNKARFVINLETGVVGFRTDETDKLPIIFKLIDDNTANAIVSGEVSRDKVISSIKGKFMSEPEFSWQDYDRQRQAAKAIMNISQRDMTIVAEKKEWEKQTEVKDEDVFSIGEIATSETKKKDTSKKNNKTDKVDTEKSESTQQVEY